MLSDHYVIEKQDNWQHGPDCPDTPVRVSRTRSDTPRLVPYSSIAEQWNYVQLVVPDSLETGYEPKRKGFLSRAYTRHEENHLVLVFQKIILSMQKDPLSGDEEPVLIHETDKVIKILLSDCIFFLARDLRHLNSIR